MNQSFFPFTEFVKACVDECGAFTEFLIDGHRHCTLADKPLLAAVPKSERSFALGGEAWMGSAYWDAPDDRHKSFLVGSFRLNEERYFQFVFLHFSVVFSKFPLLAKVQINKYSPAMQKNERWWIKTYDTVVYIQFVTPFCFFPDGLRFGNGTPAVWCSFSLTIKIAEEC